MPRITLLILILFFSQSFGLENMRCGTLRFAEELKSSKKKMLAKKHACSPDNLNINVDTAKSTNFIIYYTKKGPHAIRSNEYINTLRSYLEQAYKLHKNTTGMKGISGAQQTYHYRKTVPAGLYPIEIIDTGLLRGSEDGEYANTYGLTFPPNPKFPEKTEIIIENDFAKDIDCSENPSKQPFISWQGVNYYDKWELILKATTFHELYHAFQSTYYNMTRPNLSFWMEASATGVEEIGAPDADDYIGYLSSVQGESMENSEGLDEYGWATLYLFLYSQIGPRFDSAIWDYFSKQPKDNFSMQLARLVDSLQKNHSFDKNSEELFHEYAKQVFYSGSRAKFSPYNLFWIDMPKWPSFIVYKTTPPSVLQPGTIDFVITANEPPTAFARKSLLKNGDSQVWALSRLLEKEYDPSEDPKNSKTKEFVAYPNPWNPKNVKKVNFGPLPKNSSGVEIRSSNGALLKRIDGEAGDILTWQPEKIPAPGILYYRALPYGKNKVLIVQY